MKTQEENSERKISRALCKTEMLSTIKEFPRQMNVFSEANNFNFKECE